MCGSNWLGAVACTLGHRAANSQPSNPSSLPQPDGPSGARSLSQPAPMDSTSELSLAKTFRFTFRRNKKAKEHALDPKGPLGLTTLHTPYPEQTAVADIVFVHGLNGGSCSTWSKDNNPDCYWPQKWLPGEDGFSDVRIHAFGYPAGATRESVLNVRDMARSLLAAIRDSPSMNQSGQNLKVRMLVSDISLRC